MADVQFFCVVVGWLRRSLNFYFLNTLYRWSHSKTLRFDSIRTKASYAAEGISMLHGVKSILVRMIPNTCQFFFGEHLLVTSSFQRASMQWANIIGISYEMSEKHRLKDNKVQLIVSNWFVKQHLARLAQARMILLLRTRWLFAIQNNYKNVYVQAFERLRCIWAFVSARVLYSCVCERCKRLSLPCWYHLKHQSRNITDS